MRILHISDYVIPNMGYQESTLPKWHVINGNEVFVITSNRYTPISNYSEVWEPFLGPRYLKPSVGKTNDFVLIRLPVLFEFRNAVWLKNLISEIEKVSPDVIFVHNTNSFNLMRLLIKYKSIRCPLIVDSHMTTEVQDNSSIGKIIYFTLKTFYKLFSHNIYKFIALSSESEKFMIQVNQAPKHKILNIGFGVDTNIFHPRQDKEKLKVTYGFANDDIIIFQSGKLDETKKPHLLALAINKIYNKYPNIKLVFTGSAPTELLSKIFHNFDQNKIVFLDFANVENLAKYYCISDIVVFPAQSTLSILQASACNIPVVMSNVNENKWREDLGIGITFEKNNVDDLANTLDKLLSDNEFREQISKRSMVNANRLFSYKIISYKVEKVMSRSLSNS